MSKVLSTAIALAFIVSPMAAQASKKSVAQLQTVIAQDSARLASLAFAIDHAEVSAGKAAVSLPWPLAKAIAFDVATYQAAKTIANGSNVVERAALISNKIDVTGGGKWLGSDFKPVNPAVRFVARNSTRALGYSMTAFIGVVAAYETVEVGVGVVKLTYDLAALGVLKTEVEVAHHKLGEAVEDLAEAQK